MITGDNDIAHEEKIGELKRIRDENVSEEQLRKEKGTDAPLEEIEEKFIEDVIEGAERDLRFVERVLSRIDEYQRGDATAERAMNKIVEAAKDEEYR